MRAIASATELRLRPAADAEIVGALDSGEPFDLLDESFGWAWGYAGKERRVGYVRSDTLKTY
ncbi:MAG TPA: hypothetical protein VFK19_13815 [Sphingomicrobium sp.]|nr:hypothetical protein [Sphingomicrobium sp.]